MIICSEDKELAELIVEDFGGRVVQKNGHYCAEVYPKTEADREILRKIVQVAVEAEPLPEEQRAIIRKALKEYLLWGRINENTIAKLYGLPEGVIEALRSLTLGEVKVPNEPVFTVPEAGLSRSSVELGELPKMSHPPGIYEMGEPEKCRKLFEALPNSGALAVAYKLAEQLYNTPKSAYWSRATLANELLNLVKNLREIGAIDVDDYELYKRFVHCILED